MNAERSAASERPGARRVPRVLSWLFAAYRAAMRPFFGPSCRFEPSCSVYAEQAIALHGLWRGTGLALKRIGRCHPFSLPGLDPVPAPRDLTKGAGSHG